MGCKYLESMTIISIEFQSSLPHQRKAWDNLLEKRITFTLKKDYEKGEREAQWAAAQRTLQGLQRSQSVNLFADNNSYRKSLKSLSRQRDILRSQD